MNIQTISLDLSKAGGHERIRVGRWDSNGTTVRALVHDGGCPVDLDGMDVSLAMRLSDGSALEYPCETDGNAATATLDESDVGNRAVAFAYVRVEDGERVYSTERFSIVLLEGGER